MKKLTKAQLAQQSTHGGVLSDAEDALETAIDAFNAIMAAERSKVETALEKLNNAIADAEGWREEIAGEQELYRDEKSEKWQESDAGQNYYAWMQEWGFTLEQVELEFPEELIFADGGLAEQVEELPPSVEGE